MQGYVTVVFTVSLWFAWRNLRLFNHTHQANLLKSVVDDYRRLVEQDAFENYEAELEEWKRKLVGSDMTPVMVYDTKLSSIAQIGHFYDHLGLLLRQGLLDFRLCFEVVPVPYKFWEETEEFRNVMRRVTYAQFWGAFEHLVRRYRVEKRRRERPMPVQEALRRWSGG
jgi:hypothetical protein